MFGLFRRKPSAYAVAIRDSLINSPTAWRFCCMGPRKRGFSHAANIVDVHTLRTTFGMAIWLQEPSSFHPSRADRRCIREGIEAWIAWSVRKPTESDQCTTTGG